MDSPSPSSHFRSPDRTLPSRSLPNMTTSDYHMTMKNVGIADLKARLSEHLRAVRAGEELTVMDRRTPVARLVPIEPRGPIGSRPPSDATRLQDVPLPEPLELSFDVVQLLLEERAADR